MPRNSTTFLRPPITRHWPEFATADEPLAPPVLFANGDEWPRDEQPVEETMSSKALWAWKLVAAAVWLVAGVLIVMKFLGR